MPPRLRKLIGMIALVILVLVYALFAVTVASIKLAEAPWWGHLLYFALSGILWVVPAMFIIKWMEKPAKR